MANKEEIIELIRLRVGPRSISNAGDKVLYDRQLPVASMSFCCQSSKWLRIPSGFKKSAIII